MMAMLMGLQSVSPVDVQRLLHEGKARIYDVSSDASWHKAHIPGAVHLESEGYGAADLPADKEATLVFYCSNPLCRKAPVAAKRAKAMGHDRVRVMSAGISGWISAALPTEGT